MGGNKTADSGRSGAGLALYAVVRFRSFTKYVPRQTRTAMANEVHISAALPPRCGARRGSGGAEMSGLSSVDSCSLSVTIAPESFKGLWIVCNPTHSA